MNSSEIESSPATGLVPDSQHRGMISLLPAVVRPYAVLARFDRPIGWWLLFWPCAWSILLAGGAISHWRMILWMLLGAIAMRGAGCVYNDIADRDLDVQIERTRLRPIASGVVSVRRGWIWLALLSLIGLIVLFQLRWEAQLVALASLAPVAAYPYMKRITWWPQAWLGIVFSWGALVGWIEVTGTVSGAMLLLYAGSICWVIGYDTIYALQDREDDALVGVKSSARRLGESVKFGVLVFYTNAVLLWASAIWLVRPQIIALLALLPVALHLLWQAATLNADDGDDALAKFRSNRFAGLLMALTCLTIGSA
jgi:4-hydroxybenzoate polyprenyltransferase